MNVYSTGLLILLKVGFVFAQPPVKYPQAVESIPFTPFSIECRMSTAVNALRIRPVERFYPSQTGIQHDNIYRILCLPLSDFGLSPEPGPEMEPETCRWTRPTERQPQPVPSWSPDFDDDRVSCVTNEYLAGISRRHAEESLNEAALLCCTKHGYLEMGCQTAEFPVPLNHQNPLNIKVYGRFINSIGLSANGHRVTVRFCQMIHKASFYDSKAREVLQTLDTSQSNSLNYSLPLSRSNNLPIEVSGSVLRNYIRQQKDTLKLNKVRESAPKGSNLSNKRRVGALKSLPLNSLESREQGPNIVPVRHRPRAESSSAEMAVNRKAKRRPAKIIAAELADDNKVGGWQLSDSNSDKTPTDNSVVTSKQFRERNYFKLDDYNITIFDGQNDENSYSGDKKYDFGSRSVENSHSSDSKVRKDKENSFPFNGETSIQRSHNSRNDTASRIYDHQPHNILIKVPENTKQPEILNFHPGKIDSAPSKLHLSASREENSHLSSGNITHISVGPTPIYWGRVITPPKKGTGTGTAAQSSENPFDDSDIDEKVGEKLGDLTSREIYYIENKDLFRQIEVVEIALAKQREEQRLQAAENRQLPEEFSYFSKVYFHNGKLKYRNRLNNRIWPRPPGLSLKVYRLDYGPVGDENLNHSIQIDETRTPHAQRQAPSKRPEIVEKSLHYRKDHDENQSSNIDSNNNSSNNNENKDKHNTSDNKSKNSDNNLGTNGDFKNLKARLFQQMPFVYGVDRSKNGGNGSISDMLVKLMSMSEHSGDGDRPVSRQGTFVRPVRNSELRTSGHSSKRGTYVRQSTFPPRKGLVNPTVRIGRGQTTLRERRRFTGWRQSSNKPKQRVRPRELEDNRSTSVARREKEPVGVETSSKTQDHYGERKIVARSEITHGKSQKSGGQQDSRTKYVDERQPQRVDTSLFYNSKDRQLAAYQGSNKHGYNAGRFDGRDVDYITTTTSRPSIQRHTSATKTTPSDKKRFYYQASYESTTRQPDNVTLVKINTDLVYRPPRPIWNEPRRNFTYVKTGKPQSESIKGDNSSNNDKNGSDNSKNFKKPNSVARKFANFNPTLLAKNLPHRQAERRREWSNDKFPADAAKHGKYYRNSKKFRRFSKNIGKWSRKFGATSSEKPFLSFNTFPTARTRLADSTDSIGDRLSKKLWVYGNDATSKKFRKSSGPVPRQKTGRPAHRKYNVERHSGRKTRLPASRSSRPGLQFSRAISNVNLKVDTFKRNPSNRDSNSKIDGNSWRNNNDRSKNSPFSAADRPKILKYLNKKPTTTPDKKNSEPIRQKSRRSLVKSTSAPDSSDKSNYSEKEKFIAIHKYPPPGDTKVEKVVLKARSKLKDLFPIIPQPLAEAFKSFVSSQNESILEVRLYNRQASESIENEESQAVSREDERLLRSETTVTRQLNRRNSIDRQANSRQFRANGPVQSGEFSGEINPTQISQITLRMKPPGFSKDPWKGIRVKASRLSRRALKTDSSAEISECSLGHSLRDTSNNWSVACGYGDMVWLPQRCPTGLVCSEAADTRYRLCCRR